MKILRYTHTHNVVVTIAEHSGETEKGGKKERNKLAPYDLVTKKQQFKKKNMTTMLSQACNGPTIGK